MQRITEPALLVSSKTPLCLILRDVDVLLLNKLLLKLITLKDACMSETLAGS